ncbi:hypothetical protein HK096_001396, partial [Nowakowskiella sp. JEL0078]
MSNSCRTSPTFKPSEIRGTADNSNNRATCEEKLTHISPVICGGDALNALAYILKP